MKIISNIRFDIYDVVDATWHNFLYYKNEQDSNALIILPPKIDINMDPLNPDEAQKINKGIGIIADRINHIGKIVGEPYSVIGVYDSDIIIYTDALIKTIQYDFNNTLTEPELKVYLEHVLFHEFEQYYRMVKHYRHEYQKLVNKAFDASSDMSELYTNANEYFSEFEEHLATMVESDADEIETEQEILKMLNWLYSDEDNNLDPTLLEILNYFHLVFAASVHQPDAEEVLKAVLMKYRTRDMQYIYTFGE